MGKKEHRQSNFLGDDSKQNSQGREKDKDLNQNRDMEKMSLHSSKDSKTEWHSKKEDRGMDSISQVSNEVKSMKKDGKKIPEKGLTLKKKLKDHGLTISGDVVLRDLKKKESGKKKRKTWVLIKKTASSRKADKASSLNERIVKTRKKNQALKEMDQEGCNHWAESQTSQNQIEESENTTGRILEREIDL